MTSGILLLVTQLAMSRSKECEPVKINGRPTNVSTCDTNHTRRYKPGVGMVDELDTEVVKDAVMIAHFSKDVYSAASDRNKELHGYKLRRMTDLFDKQLEKCSYCNGTGTRGIFGPKGLGWFNWWRCPYCSGTGWVARQDVTAGWLAEELFAIYESPAGSPKEVIMALRGSIINRFDRQHTNDLAQDKEVLRGQFEGSERARQCITTYEAIKRKFPDHKIILTGHSLGGTEVCLLVAHDQKQAQADDQLAVAYTYNLFTPWGLLSRLVDWGRYHEAEQFVHDALKDERVCACFTTGDRLSYKARQDARAVTHNLIIIEDGEEPESTPFNIYDLLANIQPHDMTNFIDQ